MTTNTRQNRPEKPAERITTDRRSIEQAISQWLRGHAMLRAEQPIVPESTAAVINATAAQTMLVIARAIENREYIAKPEVTQ